MQGGGRGASGGFGVWCEEFGEVTFDSSKLARVASNVLTSKVSRGTVDYSRRFFLGSSMMG